MSYGYLTIRISRCTKSIIRLLGTLIAIFIVIHRTVQGNLQSLDKCWGNLSKAINTESISYRMGCLKLVILQLVDLREYRSIQACIHSVTIIIYLTIIIGHDIAIAISEIQRIDRSDGIDHVEGIGRTVFSIRIYLCGIVCNGMGIVYVTTHLQPFICLIGSLQACSISLKLRSVCDTWVIQIAQGSIELGIVVSTIHIHIILLSEGVSVSRLEPVVRTNRIVLSVIRDFIAQCGIRIQLSIIANEILSLRHIVADITQSAHF